MSSEMPPNPEYERQARVEVGLGSADGDIGSHDRDLLREVKLEYERRARAEVRWGVAEGGIGGGRMGGSRGWHHHMHLLLHQIGER